MSRNEPEETGRWKAINQGDNVFDPGKGKARKTDIMDKYNEYAGKQELRSVDARIERRSARPVAGFPGAHHVKSKPTFFQQSFPLEPR